MHHYIKNMQIFSLTELNSDKTVCARHNMNYTIYTLFHHEAAIVNTHKSTKTQTHKNRDMEI